MRAMIWSACTFMTRAKAPCLLQVCSPSKTPKLENCWNLTQVERRSGRNSLKRTPKGWQNWIGHFSEPVWIRFVSALQNLSHKRCSIFLKPGGEGGGAK